MLKHKVSVVMSVNKNRGYLKKTLESVLSQDFYDFEFIIVSDAPLDDTLSTLRRYESTDKRIKLIVNRENLGLSRSLHLGVSKSCGAIIARIDEGDFWYKEKLSRQVIFLDKNPDHVLVGCQYSCCQNQRIIPGITLPTKCNETRKFILRGLVPFVHPAIAFRSGLLNYNGNLSTSQDYDLYLRLFYLGKMANLRERLVEINILDDAISSSKKEVQFFIYSEIFFQFSISAKNPEDRQRFIENGTSIEEKKLSKKVARMIRMGKIIDKTTKSLFIKKIVFNILIPEMLALKVIRYIPFLSLLFNFNRYQFEEK